MAFRHERPRQQQAHPSGTFVEFRKVAEMTVVIVGKQVQEADQEDIDRMLAELEALSAEHAKQLLADEVE